MDLSKLSDDDLSALEAGDLTKLSEDGLKHLEASSTPAARPDQTGAWEAVGKGMKDPFDAGAQLLQHVLPESVVKTGNQFNNWLADKTGLVGRLPEGGVDQQVRQDEQAWNARRGDQAGKFDPNRLAGNVLSPANLAMAWKVPQALGMGARMATSGALGATSAALQPVTGDNPDNYWMDKGIQALTGGVLGSSAPVIGSTLSRLVSPRASTNPQLRMLTDRGVEPTLGQTAGGLANRIEEKSTSIPIVGDMIAARRNAAQGQFNTAAINEALEPLRATNPQLGRVEGQGFDAVNAAHQTVSDAYDAAKAQIGHVRLDQQFYNDVGQLRQMASGLTPPFQDRFNRVLRDTVQSRSQNGVMTAETFKRVDSDLGQLAANFGKAPNAAGKEFGDSIRQLQSLLNQQGYRSNPGAQASLDAADAAFARLVRIEDAAKRGVNNEGTFTPGQLNLSIKSTDRSARGNAVARGQGLMQDFANAGQTVLGNRVPDSGTAGRLGLAAGAVAAGGLHWGIPAALVGGGAMYTRPMQAAMRGAMMSRPQLAQPVAQALQRGAPRLAPAAGLAGLQMREQE